MLISSSATAFELAETDEVTMHLLAIYTGTHEIIVDWEQKPNNSACKHALIVTITSIETVPVHFIECNVINPIEKNNIEQLVRKLEHLTSYILKLDKPSGENILSEVIAQL